MPVDALGWSDDLKAGYQPELDVSLVEVPYKVNSIYWQNMDLEWIPYFQSGLKGIQNLHNNGFSGII